MQRSKPEIISLIAGAITSITALLGAVAELTGAFETVIGEFADSTSFVIWVVIAVVLGLSAYFFYRGLSKKSRLLRPGVLRIDPDNPDHLKGRAEDIANLAEAVSHPLIILEGESGSGKSALIRSGLRPVLSGNNIWFCRETI